MLNERHPRTVVICLPHMRTSITSCVAITLLIVAIGLTQTRKNIDKQFLNVDGKKPPGYTHVVTSAPGKMIFLRRAQSNAGGPPPPSARRHRLHQERKRAPESGLAGFRALVVFPSRAQSRPEPSSYP